MNMKSKVGKSNPRFNTPRFSRPNQPLRNENTGGKGKRKAVCPLTAAGGIDYKDFKILMRYVSETGKIVPRRISGVSAKMQRALSQAVKRARFLGLLPYVARDYQAQHNDLKG